MYLKTYHAASFAAAAVDTAAAVDAAAAVAAAVHQTHAVTIQRPQTSTL